MKKILTFHLTSIGFLMGANSEIIDPLAGTFLTKIGWVPPSGDLPADYCDFSYPEDAYTQKAPSENYFYAAAEANAIAYNLDTTPLNSGFNGGSNGNSNDGYFNGNNNGNANIGTYNGNVNGNDNVGDHNGNLNGNQNNGNDNGNLNGNGNIGNNNANLNGNVNDGSHNGSANGNNNLGNNNANYNGNYNLGDKNGNYNGSNNTGDYNGNQNGNGNSGSNNGSNNGSDNKGGNNGNGNGNNNSGSGAGNYNGNNNQTYQNGNKNGSVLVGSSIVDFQVVTTPPEQNNGSGNITGNQILTTNAGSSGGNGNNNGNVIINGNAGDSGAVSPFKVQAEGDAYAKGETKITIRANDDENGDGVKGDKVFTLDAFGLGNTGGKGIVEGFGNFGSGNLNGNGNGNTLLNIDYYDTKPNGDKPATEAHVSTSDPNVLVVEKYAGDILNFFASLFG